MCATLLYIYFFLKYWISVEKVVMIFTHEMSVQMSPGRVCHMIGVDCPFNLQRLSILSQRHLLMKVPTLCPQLISLPRVWVFIISAFAVHWSQRVQRGRPAGGAALGLPGRHPPVPAARGAVPQPRPCGRAGGIHGGPLHTVSRHLKGEQKTPLSEAEYKRSVLCSSEVSEFTDGISHRLLLNFA